MAGCNRDLWHTKPKTFTTWALADVAQQIEHGLITEGLLVQFPVGTCAWVVGQDPSEGHVRGNHTLMFLSLLLSLKTNKQNLF